MAKCTGYQYMSKIDISMQYYTFELDKESHNLCTIVTPFGLYRYTRLPMGVSESPDNAQEFMENLLQDLLEEIVVYIDDILVTNHSWSSYLHLLNMVLACLEDVGFLVKPLKCKRAVKEMDFLVHWMTPTGIKRWKKKVDAILRMEQPTNQTQCQSFIGMVKYYHDMWPRWTHILALLTNLMGKKKFQWNKEQDEAFKQMKALIQMCYWHTWITTSLLRLKWTLLIINLVDGISSEVFPSCCVKKIMFLAINYTSNWIIFGNEC